MGERFNPTPFAEVNTALLDLCARIRSLLGPHFVGMYVLGSLALGDFDPNSSDIDFVVVTATDIGDDLFSALADTHAQFAAGASPWASRTEAVYIPQDALRHGAPKGSQYPQLEKGVALFSAALESGWVFQRYTLREHGIVVAGPDPRALLAPVDRCDMPPAVAAIAGMWLAQARGDPAWQAWMRDRHSQTFIILTLCRMLYSLATGEVASKPAAAQWAQEELGAPWDALIARSLAGQHEPGELAQRDLDDTVRFIQFTFEWSQRGLLDG